MKLICGKVFGTKRSTRAGFKVFSLDSDKPPFFIFRKIENKETFLAK